MCPQIFGQSADILTIRAGTTAGCAAYICCTALPPTFAAYILLPMFAAYICRQHLPPTFSAYILEVRLHFEQAPIFYTCANILGKCQYFDDF